MDKSRKYATPTALRRALEDRLKRLAKTDGLNFQRLLRDTAFDRLLARLFSSDKAPWILKGGYALELRIKEARATKDIDLALRESLGKQRGDSLNEAIAEELRKAANQDMGDFFSFVIGNAAKDLDAAPYGGARFPVEARMDGRGFVKFHIDVGAGDVVLAPLSITESHDWLKFAGIPTARFTTISKEQHFAEKVHAYTLPRPLTNTRVRDIIDIVLLIRSSPPLDLALTKKAIDATFKRRNTHSMPEILKPPPTEWERPYVELARQCRLTENLEEAFRLLNNVIKAQAALEAAN